MSRFKNDNAPSKFEAPARTPRVGTGMLKQGPITRELPSRTLRPTRAELNAALEALADRRTTSDRVIDRVVDRLLEEIS